MARFYDYLDLVQNELRNVRLQNLPAAPINPVVGQIYYDTTLGTARICISIGPAVWATTDATKATGIPNTALATNPLARENHTGTQSAASISDFAEAVQDVVGAFFGAGTGVSVSYDDAANTLTVSATGGTFDPEATRDAIGAALIGVGNIAVTINDAADTITISTTATVNSTDAALRDRATHTGTQPINTVSGLQTALDGKAATAHTHPVSDLTATGTRDATTVLWGDNTWRAIPAPAPYTQGNGILITGQSIAVDTTKVVRKFISAPFGDGVATSFTIAHGLGNANPIISVRTASGGDKVFTGEGVPDANTVTITCNPAPAAGSLVAIIVG